MNDTLTNPTSPSLPPPAPATTIPTPPVAYATASPYVRPLKSPALAGVLSMLPGLGHVYLGLYKRAAIFFGVWVLIIAIVNDVGGPIGFCIPFWWFFVLIDAVRQAQAINASGIAAAAPTAEDFQVPAGGSLALGVFLILFGLFFTLRKFISIDLEFLRTWWPLVFVLFGAWQVFSYFKSKEKPREDEPAA